MEEQKQIKEALITKVTVVRESAVGQIHVRALVIDDLEFDQVLRARTLQNVGCDSVDIVESGEAALHQISLMAAQKIYYHIIACDYDLSNDPKRLNGAQCVLLFRSMPQCKEALIWCISARIEIMKAEIDEGLEVLRKPFFSQEMLFTAKGNQLGMFRKKSAPEAELRRASLEDDQPVSRLRAETYPKMSLK